MESTHLDLPQHIRRKRRRQGLGNCLYVRYADDFVVLCNGTKEQAQKTKEEIGGFLSSIGLTLSEEKTKITHITEGFIFLGYEVIRSMGGKGKLVPQVRVPDKAVKRFQHKVREILAPGTTNESVHTKITAMNQLIRGWCQYYRWVSRPDISYGKLRPEIYWNMAHWLGRKYKKSLVKVIREYGKKNSFATKTVKLLMPNEFKARTLLIKKWHNPYTEKGEIKRESILFYENLWLGTESDRHGWMDIREEVILLKGTTCYICGKVLHPSEVEVDHATKPRAAFKDRKEDDRMKHLQPICTSCHRAKTKTDLEVLSRMR